MRILLAEDCVHTRELVSEFLLALGHEVDLTATLDLAEQLVDLVVYDAVMLDLTLNGESAFPLARKLQRSGVPLIVSTGADPVMVLGELSPVNILAKPYSIESLMMTLDGIESIGRDAIGAVPHQAAAP